jgi:hypothetical protein
MVGILLCIIGGAVYWVWKQATESTAPKPVATDQAPDPAFVPAAATVPVIGAATEEIPKDRSPQDADIIAHAKNTPMSMLDSSLPHESADYWISHAAGSSAGVRWDVNDCPGASKQADSTPICVDATVKFLNGTRFQISMILGERTSDPAAPVKYTQPSLMWAAYQKPQGALVPADPSGLTQIAQQSE